MKRQETSSLYSVRGRYTPGILLYQSPVSANTVWSRTTYRQQNRRTSEPIGSYQPVLN